MSMHMKLKYNPVHIKIGKQQPNRNEHTLKQTNKMKWNIYKSKSKNKEQRTLAERT